MSTKINMQAFHIIQFVPQLEILNKNSVFVIRQMNFAFTLNNVFYKGMFLMQN